MTTNLIPEQILAIIEHEEKASEAETLLKMKAREKEKKANIKKGLELWIDWRDSLLAESVPAVLWDYVQGQDDMLQNHEEDDLERIGQMGKVPSDGTLIFHIPGLAPIYYYPNANNGNCWSVPADVSVDGGQVKYRDWFNTRRHFENASSAILQAKKTCEKYTQLVQEQEAREAQQRAWDEQEREREQQAAARHAKQQAQQELEAEKLIKLLDGDDALMHLLKAIVAIRQERGLYESRLEDADETIYSIEERYSRQASRLREQAQEAERRAEEERSRASELEDDLASARRKEKRG